MTCPLCKSNDIRKLDFNRETEISYSEGKFLMSYDITFYYCMDCNNIFGKRDKY